jgi:hypothetical protein
VTSWSYWRARIRLHLHSTRAQRKAALRFADDTLVALWMATSPGKPLQAASRELPLSGRRTRQALKRLNAKAQEGPE